MPGRDIIFTNGGIYHVYNKTIEGKRIFSNPGLRSIFLDIFRYYRSSKVRLSYSRLRDLDIQAKEIILKDISFPTYFKLNVLAYCLMPTHFHFLVLQKNSNGVQKCMNDVINSFTRYFNIKSHRDYFFALMHVSRYIHLNPYSSRIIIDKNKLPDYRFSSFPEYLSRSTDQKKIIQNEKVTISVTPEVDLLQPRPAHTSRYTTTKN